MTPAQIIFQTLVFLGLSMSFFLFCININNNIIINIAKKVRDRPLEILRGGGGEVQKKNISARENLMGKNSRMQLNPKKYSCNSLKKFVQGKC